MLLRLRSTASLLLVATLITFISPAVHAQCAAGTGAVSLAVTTTCNKVILSGFTAATDEAINGVYDLQVRDLP